MAEYGEFSSAAEAVLRSAAALYPTPTATTVRVSEKGGHVLTTEGPYAETKEVLTGSSPGVRRSRRDHSSGSHYSGCLERCGRGPTRHRDVSNDPASIPSNPVAWMRLAARRRAVDLDPPRGCSSGTGVRSDGVRHIARTRRAALDVRGRRRPPATAVHLLPPEPLPENQVSLALHTLCALSTTEVARALLVPESTMAKRFTRARQKTRKVHIPYRIRRTTSSPTAGRRCWPRRTCCSARGTPRRQAGSGPHGTQRRGDPADEAAGAAAAR